VEEEDLKSRTKRFAHDCVKLAAELPNTFLGNHIRGQLIRCSTSVASNYRAVCFAQSRASFISKLSIVLEEADESFFWLEFILDEGLFENQRTQELMKEAKELISIFAASRITAGKKMASKKPH
jgi:four helix bundle protein